MALRGTSGFTLIELAITLVVLGILTALGLPVFTDWINNTKIRTAAEGVANGLQLARTEAVRQNSSVQFVLGGASGASAWTVNAVSTTGTTLIQQRTNEGSGNAIVGVLPTGATTVTYSGIGAIAPNGDGTPTLTQIDVCSSAAMLSGNMVKMRITIGTGGNVKMCNPNPALQNSPQGCPVSSVSQC